MKLNKIIYESPGEIKGEFADVVYFQGCSRSCCFCFNPQLRDQEAYNLELTPTELVGKIKNTISKYVVLTGGEPLEQDYLELGTLIDLLKLAKKKIVLETSQFDSWIYSQVNHVLYSIKTFDVNEVVLKEIVERNMNFVTCVVVTDHECFDYNGFMKAIEILNILYCRTKDDVPLSKSFINLKRIAKKYNKKIERFTKLCLSKKNLKKSSDTR